ncbi:hypothetical protein AMJ40_04820 [candidate division TA06 bacterium DG_26]|uniref:tRNA-2-methylthio-N(6)-dimethylallyladenosine synthase n=1 Tax=candidate division TA06 bacterium DG_26 TaxID=1703771 RepID=A0A0S7WHY3_UNCT6|nr:MAG: hypothetical protein AMJ40_04820 [candidate division TA06 bacterium DG_26]
MMKYHIITYGCQMNLYDSGLIATLLEASGFESARTTGDADIILVNTCSVRQHAERRAMGRIASLANSKSQRDGLRIGVVGCMAKRYGQSLFSSLPFIDFVVGPDQYRRLPEIIGNGKRTASVDEDSEERYSELRSRQRRGPCAFIAIMRGCNNFCSYCVVPYLRGRERSRPHGDIIRETEALTEQGVKEITLLGQNVNSYRDGTVDFPGLLEKLCGLSRIERIRFTTSHPKDVSVDLFRVMGSKSKVCNWLHLPVQSGSNRILELMNRRYSREQYLGLVAAARGCVQELSVTTDVMVGFPGETDEDFLRTVDLIQAIRFDFAYMFIYSNREGTAAANLEDLPLDIKKKRLEHIIDLQNRITKEQNTTLVGKQVELLVEGECKKGDYDGYGKTSNNKVVLFKGFCSVGDLVRVEVHRLSGWTPWGEIING